MSILEDIKIDSYSNNWLLSLTTLFIISYVAKFYFQYFTRESPLPGPIPIPLFGNLLQMGNEPAIYAQKMQKKYGDMWEVYMASERNIYLSRADLIEKMMSSSTKTSFFQKGSENEGLVELGLTTQGIICNGNMKSWQFNRKFLTHSIMSPNFLKDFVQETQSLFNEMGNYWSNLGTDFQIDLAQWMYRFTTDTMLKSTTGKPFYSVLSYYNTLVPTKIKVPGSVTIEPEEFLDLITNWLTMVMYFLLFSNLIRHYIPGFRQFTQKLLAKNEQLDEKVLKIIEERRKDIESSSETPLQNDILTSLLTANTSRDTNSSSNDEALKPLTNDEIRQIMLDVFIAGIDTTSNSFCFVIYYVCQHPDVKSRLLQEIHQIFGSDPHAIQNAITYESLDKLIYTEAIIKEVARLIPVAPLLFKELGREDVIGGLKFKPGTMFCANQQGIHRSTQYWKDPEKFIPERFVKGSEFEAKNLEKNAYNPFGGGLRLCPGRHVAMAELKVLIVLLFGRYDVQLADPKSPLKYSLVTLNQCNELKVLIRPKTN